MVTKKANLGVAPKKDLELSFASVAYATIRDKVPRLVQDNSLRGFQLLDKSDDNKKAAGVFGAKVGDRWFYMPSFFVRNELKGSELLFTDKIFTPLSEAWVNYFLTKTGLEVGSGRSYKQPRDRFGGDPSTDQVIYGRKLGEFIKLDQAHDLAFMEAAGDAFEKNLSGIKVASADDVLKIITKPQGVTIDWLARSSPSAFVQLRKLAVTRPVIRNWLFKQYGNDCLQKWASVHLPARPLTATLKRPVMTVKEARTNPALNPVETGSLRVIRYSDFKLEATPGTLDSDVDVAKRNRLAVDKELVEDERSDEQVSVTVVDMSRKINNPTSPGVYNVLTTEGVKKCYVLPRPCGPLTIKAEYGKTWMVVDHSSKKFILSPAHGIYVEGEKLEPANAIYDAASASKPDGLFVLVTPHGEVSQPLKTMEGTSGTLRVTNPSNDDLCPRKQVPPSAPVSVTPANETQRRADLASTNSYIAGDAMVERDVRRAQIRNEEDYEYGAYPVMFDGTDAPRVAGGVIRVPKETRYLKVTGEDPGYALIQSPNDFARKVATSGARRVTVSVANGSHPDYVVKVGDFETFRGNSYSNVRLHLLAKQAMRQDDAEELLKRAKADTHAYAWVAYPQYLETLVLRRGIKEASFGMPDMGPPFPQLPENSMQLGRNNIRMLENGVQSELVPERERNWAQEHEDPYLRYRAEDFSNMGEQQMHPVEQAMNDEREIEGGTRLLQMLLQNTSIEREIRLAAKKAMEALNQYGKLLYSIYWRYEDFEEVFGEDRMPEVEDSIRNTFDSNGKVALQLSERIQNQSMTDLQDIDLASLADS